MEMAKMLKKSIDTFCEIGVYNFVYIFYLNLIIYSLLSKPLNYKPKQAELAFLKQLRYKKDFQRDQRSS